MFVGEATAVFQGEGFFVKWTGYFGLILHGAGHAAAEGHLAAVWTKILGCIPFISAGKKE